MMKSFLVFLFITMANGALAQSLELKPEEILKLLPDRIAGYSSNEEFVTKQMTIGKITYMLCEKKFERGGKSIKFLLFDFSNAEIMYTQAMSTWKEAKPIETDSIVMRAVAMDNYTGWESYRKRTGQSQIFLGICNRFFLSLTADNVDLPNLKSILTQVPIDKFPK